MSDSPSFPIPPPPIGARLSFFDEQANRRRQAKRWGWVTMAVAGALGWVLGFLVMAGVLFYVLLLQGLLPHPLAQLVDRLAPNSDAVLWPLIGAGFFFAVGLWMVVRMCFGRDASIAFRGRLRARAPNLADPEEKQLVNVVEEMALAAAAPTPNLMLFDGDTINAAALGDDAAHVTLLVSRRLLDVLDRDETQGVIGQLTASAVNGDLSLTTEMLRLFHVLGLSVAILDLPFSARARSACWALIPLVFRAKDPAVMQQREAIAAQLTESLQPEGLTPMNEFMRRWIEPANGSPARKVIGVIILMPLLPLVMIRIGAAIIYGLLSLFVLGPLIAGLLRSRRRLADATAVQLTRNPDGLACALVKLGQEANTIEHAGWAEMLFIVGPEAAGARRLGQLQRRMGAIRDSGGDWTSRARAGMAATSDFAASDSEKSEAKKFNFIFGFHPSLNSRIMRLKKMGATQVEWNDQRDYSGWIIAAVVAFVLGVVVLIALAGAHN